MNEHSFAGARNALGAGERHESLAAREVGNRWIVEHVLQHARAGEKHWHGCSRSDDIHARAVAGAPAYAGSGLAAERSAQPAGAAEAESYGKAFLRHCVVAHQRRVLGEPGDARARDEVA